MKKTAKQLGKELGKTAQEVNELLKEKGYLDGNPNHYILTNLGEKFAEIVKKDNGYGGYAKRNWEFRIWAEDVLEDLIESSKNKNND